MRKAVIRGSLVENIIEAPAGWPAPAGTTLIDLADGVQCGPGWTFSGGIFTAPANSPPRSDLEILGSALVVTANLVVDEFNLIREWLTSFKSATAAATTLADFKTRVAALPDMPDRTKSQVVNQIRNGL